ncbi:poly(adp-ribose) glycohydrolase [Cystoisospora suis]|uniref:poly(ADP-ribose) glycohydrolase n=1 Tax=Cystoisospora suis TaxID=483139 RepID=A0A2C6L0P3_9APIC|nr:poly(adp-ribose) glycohydrolase [Cystoisospora suis]
MTNFRAAFTVLAVAMLSLGTSSHPMGDPTSMHSGEYFASRCPDAPCTVLRVPVEHRWQSVKALLHDVAVGKGPVNADQLSVLHRRLLYLSGNWRTDKTVRQEDLLKHLSKRPGSFFHADLPFMASVVSHLEDLFPAGLMHLTPRNPQIHLRKIQVYALLAAAFLGVIPHNQRDLLARHPRSFTLHLNKLDMFFRGFMERAPKFEALLTYFSIMRERLEGCWSQMVETSSFSKASCSQSCSCSSAEKGERLAASDELIGFYRHTTEATVFTWLNGYPVVTAPAVTAESIATSSALLQRFDVLDVGDITESDDNLQVDFADRYLGGLSMFSDHIAQEELLFVVYPELHVVMLFSDVMKTTEAVVIKGVERFVFFEGYEHTFRITSAAGPWSSLPQGKHYSVQGVVPLDKLGRRNVTVVAIDAIEFHRPSDQYDEDKVNRELVKAAVGFKGDPYEAIVSDTVGMVATGLWGCGVFGGDAQLKSLLQWLAASAAGRPLKFYTFGRQSLRHMPEYVAKLQEKYRTVRRLYEAIQMALKSRVNSQAASWSLWNALL